MEKNFQQTGILFFIFIFYLFSISFLFLLFSIKMRNDWEFWDKCVPEKLKELHFEKGFTIIIFTNQGGVPKKQSM